MKTNLGVILRVKTCEVFLCFLAIIFLGSIVLTSQWLLCIHVIGESSALHILHRRLHKTFAINCMFFLAIHLILFSYIQLILLWTKTSPNKQFKLSILLLPWVLSGILVVPNVFLNCSEQSGMIPMANCCKTDGNKTTIIIAYYDKIQENTTINAVL